MSMLIAEQIVKSLSLRGVALRVGDAGSVRLTGTTRNVTDDDREAITRYKPEVVHYVTESPLVGLAMYIATELTWWTTDKPDLWADKVTVNGKTFVRLTRDVVVWLRQQVLRAEVACKDKKISLDQFGAIVEAFCPVYEFAVRANMIPDPAAKARTQDNNGGTSRSVEVA